MRQSPEHLMPPQSKRILTGLALQASALLITWASVELLYAIGWLAMLLLGVPLFIASVVVLMRSGGSIWVRLALSFWPAVIPLAVTGVKQAIVGLQWARVRTEVFLIPAGYRGDVTVNFDVPEGVPPEREYGTTIFRIPADGELLTRDHASWFQAREVNQAMDARREFYFVDGAGKRTRIEQGMVSWGISYDNFEPVNGTLEESRYKYYIFSVGPRR